MLGYDTQGVPGRNVLRNRSFRRLRRKSSESFSAVGGFLDGDTQDELRMRSGSGTMLHHVGRGGGGGGEEMRGRSGTDSADLSGNRFMSVGSVEAESMIKTECKKQTLHPVWNETYDL